MLLTLQTQSMENIDYDKLGSATYEAHLALKVESLKEQLPSFALWGTDGMPKIAQAAVAKDIQKGIGYRLLSYPAFCRFKKAEAVAWKALSPRAHNLN